MKDRKPAHGGSTPASAIRFWRSSPLRPGIRTSRMSHPGSSPRFVPRNSWAEERVSTRSPSCAVMMSMTRPNRAFCANSRRAPHRPTIPAVPQALELRSVSQGSLFRNRSTSCWTSRPAREGRILIGVPAWCEFASSRFRLTTTPTNRPLHGTTFWADSKSLFGGSILIPHVHLRILRCAFRVGPNGHVFSHSFT